MLSSGMKCYHLGRNVIIWDEMLSSRVKCYHLELMLSSGTKCYHLGRTVIIWDAMLSSGASVIIWDKMLSCGANVVMLSFGANVIIWCYRVMLSSWMITPPYFIFPENFTHSKLGQKTRQRLESKKTWVYAQKPQLKMTFKNSISVLFSQGNFTASIPLNSAVCPILCQARPLRAGVNYLVCIDHKPGRGDIICQIK